MANTKKCPKCGRELPLSEFYKDRTKKDGLMSYCKYCKKQYVKQYNAEHTEAKKQYNKKYYADNIEARKQYGKQWHAEHRDERKQYFKQYNIDNSEARKQYYKQRHSTLEGHARQIRNSNLQQDRKYGRCGKDEDPLPSIEQYIELLQQPDFYDGKQYHWSEMGIDRIDNSKPHTIDNVVPCTTEHNVQRQKMSFEEFCKLLQN